MTNTVVGLKDNKKLDNIEAPFNLEAERLLLGALLVNNNQYELVSELLQAQHFYDKLHQELYTTIKHLIDKGATADPITVQDYFTAKFSENPEELKNYLIDICSQVYGVVEVSHYAQIIYEYFLRRELMALGHDVVTDARTVKIDETAEKIVEKTEQRLFNLLDFGRLDKGTTAFNSILDETLTLIQAAREKGDIVGCTTGLNDLDKKLGGLHPSDLIILAGRPSMGKTALATNIAYNTAKSFVQGKASGAGVLLFSLEMSASQLAARMLATEAQVSSDKIRRGDISTDAYQNLFSLSQEMGKLPIYIDDTPALTISSIRTRARRMKRLNDIGLIVVDYLQLLHGTSAKGSDNRVNEISEISRGLKAIAKELNVPIVALSQLSRAVESREDKRPQLSDLRESGSIEQDADVVMFVYREEYYLARLEPNKESSPDKYQSWENKINPVRNLAEVIIAKQRHGPIGTVKLHFNPEITHFGNYDYVHTGV